jgi:hypothetical protein
MLKQLNTHARDINITFEEEGHKYTINGETNYTSVTTWLKKFFYPFNDELIITNMMKSPKWPDSKYFGMTKDEIKKQWRDNGNEAAKLGTAMHKMFEDHYNGLYVDGSNTGVEYEYFTNFINDHPTLKPFRSEWTVYDEDLRLSGSIDMLFINEDGTLSIYDWKRCKSMDKTVSFNKYAKPPIRHIPDTNFWHYSIQLNAYKMIIERKYGYKIKDMFLVCIHPELDTNYQKHEVEPMDLSVLFNQIG